MPRKFTGSGGAIRWTNYLMASGGVVGMHVENSDETVSTRYFHKDHLGSIAVITDEAGAVLERLSYDAWGKRRNADGSDDPSGSITSQTSRGYTGHEELDSVGLVHMNGRVYDPLLARFGTADPTTESPFSTQGWNRYSYVGNSPLNFTDPSGYCFMGCFWKPIFKAIGNFFRENWRSLVQMAAVAFLCGPGAPICAGIVTGIVVGITSGDLGLALRSGFIAAVTAAAFMGVAEVTGHNPAFLSPAHAANMAGHALVGCASAVASGGKCGPGALSGAAGSFVAPFAVNAGYYGGLAISATVGGLASVAGGGKFGNGALTAAFGYLFNSAAACGRGRCAALGFALGAAGGAYFAAGAEAVTLGANTPLILPEIAMGALGGLILGGMLDILGWSPPNILNAKTLEPGPYAGDSIPARGPERDFTPEEREQINEIGRATGCHTCGTTDPGTKTGNFVLDHQPPSSQNPDDLPQRLYPHCLHCSKVQGGEARQAK